MGRPVRDNRHHTYADYLGWPDTMRFELIDGVAYAMGPAPARVHQELLGAMFAQVYAALEARPCRPYVAPFDVRLPKAGEPDKDVDSVVQPDLVVVCDQAKLDDRGCRGAPDWIVEILSPRSAGHDQIVKLALYERAGVREYWLVHPTDRLVTIYRLENGVFARPSVHEMQGVLAVGVLPDVNIDWSRALRGRAPPG
jgi:Uma2 family endonuclease